jgi:hypothetical protein
MKKLDQSTFPRVIIILSELIISGFLMGILIDKYLMATKPEFRDWRKQKDKRKKKG